MYRIYFTNFCYYSANTATNIKDAKDIARKAGFDSVIELDNEPVCTYSGTFGFVNIYPPEIKLERVG
jgi:hypothetical protein